MLQFIKAQGATKKEMDKEPTKTINQILNATQCYKILKNLKDKKRDALLARYFMKCQHMHCDKFFGWRTKFRKLKLTQKIVVMNAIQTEYAKENPDWLNDKIYKLQDVRVPP